MKPIIVLAALLLASSFALAEGEGNIRPQTSTTPPASFTVTFGTLSLQSREGLTQFWKGGPGASLSLLAYTGSAFAVGMGMDASMLWFKESQFSQAYPSVELRRKDIAWIDLYLVSRYLIRTGGRLTPYAEFRIGASRITGAVYQQIVNEVRETYYEIAGRTRLAAALTGGVEYPQSDHFALVAEISARNVHNDADVAWGLLLHAGCRITF